MESEAKPIFYNAHHGTTFKSNQQLRDGIEITRPLGLPDSLFAADCIEFGGWHGVNVWSQLHTLGFSGYDGIETKIQDAMQDASVLLGFSGYAGIETKIQDAAITVTRTNPGEGAGKIRFDIEWQGNRLKMEMELADFALLVTGRGATPAVIRWWRGANADNKIG